MKIRFLFILILFAFASPAQSDLKGFFIQAMHADASVEKPGPAQFDATTAPPAPVVAPDTTAPPLATPAPDALLKEGMDHFEARRYENAIEQLSRFMSLYPAHIKTPSAMITVAGILLEIKRPLAAIRLYSHVLARYPETPEALEAMTAIADMGMRSPGLKPNIAVTGARWFLDPVDAYDTVLSKNPSPDLTERLLSRRINALRSQGRYREAYASAGQFLEQNPGTKHRQTLLAGLRSDLGCLIGERFAAGDDIAVINLLLNGRRRGLINMGDTNILIKAAGSYARSGMTDEARTLLDQARHFAADYTAQVNAVIGEPAQAERSSAASSPVIERWALYQKGRQQIMSSDPSAAEKTFKQVRGTGEDEFWSKLADFASQDGIFTAKYKDYMKK